MIRVRIRRRPDKEGFHEIQREMSGTWKRISSSANTESQFFISLSVALSIQDIDERLKCTDGDATWEYWEVR